MNLPGQSAAKLLLVNDKLLIGGDLLCEHSENNSCENWIPVSEMTPEDWFDHAIYILKTMDPLIDSMNEKCPEFKKVFEDIPDEIVRNWLNNPETWKPEIK